MNSKPMILIALSAFLIYAVHFIDGVGMLAGFAFMILVGPLMFLVGEGAAFSFVAKIIWWLILCAPGILGMGMLLRNNLARNKFKGAD